MEKCIICEKEYDSYMMFGDRCGICCQLGFGIWGYGQRAQEEADKKYSIEVQRKMIKKEMKKTIDIKFTDGDKFYALSLEREPLEREPLEIDGCWIRNEEDEGMKITRKQLFDIFDKYFKEEF